ncbi:MAG: LamG-like jellyroll fold domain-containing protein, partial [Pseudomonadota bacterium]
MTAYGAHLPTRSDRLKPPQEKPSMMTQVPAPVFSQSATRSYDGTPESVRDLGHRQAFELDAATLSLTFTADSLPGEMALLTKDRSGASEGQFQILLINGVIHIEQESSTGGEWLKIPDLVVSAGTEYHIALSFGPDGLLFYVNGALAAAEPTFKYGMSSNIDHLLVGGSRAHRSSMEDTPHSVFKGEIGDIAIHSGQLSEGQIGHLASMAGVTGGHGHHGMMSSLAPAFEQMHHGSEWLQETAESYGMWQEHRPVDGVMMHGPSRMLDMLVGTPNADTLEGDDGDNLVNGSGAKDDGINGLAGNDLLKGWAGDDVIQGGYGNDTVEGGLGNDILMGGHGEDVLRGGRGDDWLISLSDAREQTPYYIPGRDEGDPYNELTNGKLYPDQPIPGDDVMEGGWGADIFYFQTLINAKERYIEKHTNDDGVINWHGVAGENDKLHDHWVDMLGNDVILDYRYSEGDRIVIEGHTTEIASITYGDENGDGVMDYSLIELYSDQGNNGGAHQYDRLGTIKVYGELVKWGDVHVDDDPAYGIVHDIAQLDEAIAPTFESVEAGP